MPAPNLPAIGAPKPQWALDLLASFGYLNTLVDEGRLSPAELTETIMDIANGVAAGAVTSVNGDVGAIVLDKTDVGLGNVNNTADANKPISSATQVALDSLVALAAAKAPGMLPTGIGPRNGRWNPNTRVYLPNSSPGIRKFRSKLGKIRTGTTDRAKMAMLGHSGYTGNGTTAPDDLPRKLRRRFALKSGMTVGTGDIYPNTWNANVSTAAAADSRVTRSGTWSVFGGGQTGGSGNTWHWLASGASGSYLQWAFDVPATTITLTYWNTSGTPTILIDGAAPSSNATITTTGVNAMTTVTWTGLSNTPHTLRVTQSTSTGIAVTAANAYTPGDVEFNNVGVYGSRTNDWIDFVSNYKVYAEMMMNQPDAAAIFLGGNEYITGVSAATFQANLNTLLTQLDSVGIEAFLIGGYGASSVTDAQWLGHRKVLWDTADARGIPLLDFYDLLGPYTEANGNGMYADGVHLSSAGLEQPADLLAQFIAA